MKGIAMEQSAAKLPRVSKSFIAMYGLAYFGLWMALLTPPIITLALRVADIAGETKEASLALILGMGALVAMVANPLAGSLSDRTRSPFGMRRPWLLGGIVFGCVGLYMIATGNVLQITIGWCITQAGFNAVLATLIAVLPDQVPSEQRGSVAGILGLCSQVAIVSGVALVERLMGSPVLMLMVPGLVACACIALFCARLPDRRLGQHEAAEARPRLRLANFWISPRKEPDFAWAFSSRFLFFLGLATLLAYKPFYLMEQLAVPKAEVASRMLVATLVFTVANVLSSLLSGWISDRLQRRKIFVLVAAVIYACGLATIAIASTMNLFLIGIAICGVGQGVYLAVDLALVTEILPNQSKNAARDMGIFNLASSMPQSIAPVIGPIFLAIGVGADHKNYTALFAAAALFALAGAFTLNPIKRVR